MLRWIHPHQKLAAEICWEYSMLYSSYMEVSDYILTQIIQVMDDHFSIETTMVTLYIFIYLLYYIISYHIILYIYDIIYIILYIYPSILNTTAPLGTEERLKGKCGAMVITSDAGGWWDETKWDGHHLSEPSNMVILPSNMVLMVINSI
jgi:hypothetical protein